MLELGNIRKGRPCLGQPRPVLLLFIHHDQTVVALNDVG